MIVFLRERLQKADVVIGFFTEKVRLEGTLHPRATGE